MNEFFEKNKTFFAIIIGALIIGGFIYFSKSPLQKPSQTYRPSDSISLQKNQLSDTSQSGSIINYTEAQDHIGEHATVKGNVVKIFISKKGTIFFDYCADYKTCPFSAVVFNSDSYKFSNIKQYEGKIINVSGLIKTYQGKAEIIVNDPNQIN